MAKGKRTNPPREEAPRRDIAGNTQNARGGRQQRPLDPGERVVMNFRVTPELKQRLGRSAELSGRSLTQEIEFRLYKSFAEQDQAELFHSAVYNQKVAGLLAILTRVMRDVGAFASLYSTGSIDRAEWLSNAYAFNQVDRAISACIQAIRPPRDPSPAPDKGQGYDLSKLGAMIAARLLQ